MVIGEDRAVVALSGFVQFDLVVLDRRCLELLGDASLYVACSLPDLQQSAVCLVINRLGVDARPGFRLWREEFFDGFTHLPRRRPSGGSGC